MATGRQSAQRLVFKQGYLKKIPNSNKFGASFKRADRRWFVFGALCGIPFLEYYESEEGQFGNPPINSISLMTCRFVTRSEDVRYHHVIHIGLVDRVLSLVAPTEEDLKVWEQEFKKKLSKLGVLQGESESQHVYTDAPFGNVRMRKNSRDPTSPLPATPDESSAIPLLSDAAAMGTTLLRPHSNARPSGGSPGNQETNGNSNEPEATYEHMWNRTSVANRDSTLTSSADPNLYSQLPRQPTHDEEDYVGASIPLRNGSRNLSIVAGRGRTTSDTGAAAAQSNNAEIVGDRDDAQAAVMRQRSERHTPDDNRSDVVSSYAYPPVVSNEPVIVSSKMQEAYGQNDDANCPIFGWSAPPPEDGAPPPYTPSPRPPSRQLSVKSLKESQTEHLQQEISNTGGVRVVLSKADCHQTVAFVDCFGAVWIAGWNQAARPMLYTALHIGDQLISVNSQVVENARVALKLIKRCTDQDQITLLIRRTPHAKVHAVRRTAQGQNLGVHRDAGTAEIVYVDPQGLAATSGLTPKTPTLDRSSFCNWVLTEINHRPLNLFFKDNEIEHRLNAVGLDITFLVQPKDFITLLKKQLKTIKNYKDFIIQ